MGHPSSSPNFFHSLTRFLFISQLIKVLLVTLIQKVTKLILKNVNVFADDKKSESGGDRDIDISRKPNNLRGFNLIPFYLADVDNKINNQQKEVCVCYTLPPNHTATNLFLQ